MGRDADEFLGSAVAGALAFAACLVATTAMLAFRVTLGAWIPFGVFVAVVIAFGRSAGLFMGPYIGLVAAFFFDFFFTRPYGSIHIDSERQLVACVALIALGLGLGLARWASRTLRRHARGREGTWPISS
jgi:K+-sensing histidine kinase KdpD